MRPASEFQQGPHGGARTDGALARSIEDGIAARRGAHAHQPPLACVPDDEGKIAFEALQAFQPALPIDGKGQCRVVVLGAVPQLGRRQFQSRAQVVAVVEPADEREARARGRRQRHQGGPILVAVILNMKLGFVIPSKYLKTNRHGSLPSEPESGIRGATTAPPE